MPLPPVPDTYRITLFMNFMGEEVINVFYYRDIVIGTYDPLDIAQGFWDHIKVTWRAFLQGSSAITYVRVVAELLMAPFSFATYPIPLAEQPGSRAGAVEHLPIFCAVQAKLNVSTRQTRPGSKRIWGLLESDVNELSLTPAAMALWDAAAQRLAVPFTPVGAPTTVQHVIVGYPTPNYPPPPRVQDVTSVTTSPSVSHQVSRDRRN